LRADLVAITGCEIDLLSLNTASVVLGWEVADSGRCLYVCNEDEETEFVTRARSRYWDFKPFLEEQWCLTGGAAHDEIDEPLPSRLKGLAQGTGGFLASQIRRSLPTIVGS
jgi:hypothetical protein